MYYDPSWIFSNKQPEKPQPNITGLMGEDWPPKQKKAEAKPITELSDIFTKPQPAAKQEPEQSTILDRVGYYMNPMNFVKNQIAKNINPFSYRDPYKRAVSAIFSKEEGRERSETSDDPAIQSRMDFLRLYTGEPQQHNTLSESTYKPTNAKDPNAKYYRINNNEEFVNYLLKTIRNDPNRGDEFFKYAPHAKYDPYNAPLRGMVQNPEDTRWLDHLNETNLGTYIKSLGQDELGKYVSYYDKWDIEPRDFGTPFELYDRIYYTIDENGNAVRVIPNQTK